MIALTTLTWSGSVYPTSISGGGVTTWSKAVDYPVTAHGYDAQIWYGTVTSTGSSTITVNYPGGAPSDWIEFNAQEFSSSAGSGTTWGVDHTGTQSNASSTTETFPSLSPSGSGELYFGYADAIGGYPSVGSTSGFTYGITSGANVVAYDTNVSSPSAYQPTASVSPAEVSLALATAFTASGSGGGGGAATISAVGSLASNAATGLSTLSVGPQHVGDMIALTTLTWSGSVYPTSISGGGVTTWSKAVDYPVTADGYDAQIWYGTVTTTGSSTITVNYPGGAPSDWIEFNAQEFSSSTGTGTTWAVDHTGTKSNASSTTETFPSLSPSGSGELYFGYADAIGGYPSVGSTSGFTYGITSGANVVAYDTSVSSPSAYQPTASVSPAEVSLALATTFTATGSGGGGGAATISAVGSLASNAATGLSTLAVGPQHVGDMIALTTLTWSGSVYPTSISGGGVTTWSKAVDYPVTAHGYDAQIWYGTVTSTGSSTITVNYPGGAPSDWIEFNAQEFSSSAGSGTTWGVDHTGTQSNASSTTETFPSLSPSGSGELYFGYADAIGGYPSVGSTSGFTYGITSGANVVAYDTSVSSPSAYQPTASVSPAEVSLALATTFTATGSGGCTTGSGSGSGPIVTGISPCSGSTSGGTSVVITGSNFAGVTGVKFGTVAASSYTVTSSTSITAVAPAGSAGSVDVTVSTGNMRLQELAAYSAYGVQTIQAGADVTPFGFQGSYTDPSGLIYLVNRYYDPATGEFLTVDPDVATTNAPYFYAGDDPVNESDPSGEWANICHGVLWLGWIASPALCAIGSATATTPGASLYRLGTKYENAAVLQASAASAQAGGFPFGVSVLDRRPSNTSNYSTANTNAVEQEFHVAKTGSNRNHYTVVLPNPVTAKVAAKFNQLFGRNPPASLTSDNGC